MPGIELDSVSPRVPLKVGQSPVGKAVVTASRTRLLTSNITVESLTPSVREFIKENERVCQPDKIYVCDGSVEENQALIKKLQEDGRLKKLEKYENW